VSHYPYAFFRYQLRFQTDLLPLFRRKVYMNLRNKEEWADWRPRSDLIEVSSFRGEHYKSVY